MSNSRDVWGKMMDGYVDGVEIVLLLWQVSCFYVAGLRLCRDVSVMTCHVMLVHAREACE